MRIGIFGGTFDPPHLGHLILASEAKEQLSLEKVLWLLTPFPPHKKQVKISSLTHRQKMVELAIQSSPEFVLSRVDIDRPPPHFALDTLIILHRQSPADDYYYLMGLDSLNELPTWHAPAQFVDMCSQIIVMLRKGEQADLSQLELSIPGLSSKVIFLNTPTIDISGTDIRQRAHQGRSFRYFVPEGVYRYILKHKLYVD